MLTTDQIANDLSPEIEANNAALAYTDRRRAKIGNGEGDPYPEDRLSEREVFYRGADDENDRGVALLDPNCPIHIDLMDGYYDVEVWVANGIGSQQVYVVDIADGAGEATGGRTPIEGAINAAAFPTQDRLVIMRLRPSDSGGLSVYVDVGPYTIPYEKSDGSMGFIGSADVNIADPTDGNTFNPTDAELGTDEHRLVGIAFDPAAEQFIAIPGSAVSTSETLPGHDSRSEFVEADYAAISFRGYYPAGYVYMYENQEDVAEDDCLKEFDPRLFLRKMGADGDVAGPGASTDNAVARFDGTSGSVIQNSGVTIDDSNNVAIPAAVTASIYKLPASTELTESSDSIMITQSYHTVKAETSTTDNLATINGGANVQILMLQAKAAHTITVKNGTGNIFLNGGIDFVLSGDKSLLLFYDGTNWADVGIPGSGSTPDASVVTYTPADNADYGGSDPGDVDNALDNLAGRLTDAESDIVGLSSGGVPEGGWVASGETWTYGSADDPTYTFTISGDLTGKYNAGMRIRVSQSTGGTKYFIVTKVAHAAGTSTITIYGGTDYDLNNETISSPYYSVVKAPLLFPLDPVKWTVTTTDASLRSQASPTAGTWYNLGTLSIAIPIGCWRVTYGVSLEGDKASTTSADAFATLSTANNSESDVDFTTDVHAFAGSATDFRAWMRTFTEKHLALTAKTSYFLNAKVGISSMDAVYFRGDVTKTIIRAICAYL